MTKENIKKRFNNFSCFESLGNFTKDKNNENERIKREKYPKIWFLKNITLDKNIEKSFTTNLIKKGIPNSLSLDMA